MSAEIFKRALAELGLDQSAADTGTRGTVVLGTVHTDIHDIGKNIVASVLSANGFKVVDLGVDVPAQQFVDAARENDARVIGLSCLLTTAFPAMKETVAAFADAGLRDRSTIIIGGGPVNADLGAAARRRRRRRQRPGRRHPRRQGRRRRCLMIAPSDDPRRERLRKAVALEPVDKVPVCLEGVAWSARVTGMTLETFLSDPLLATQANIDAFELVGNADSVNNPIVRRLVAQLPVDDRVKRPGFDGLGDDEPWQVEESGLMTPEDYDAIVERGWAPFQARLPERARRPGQVRRLRRVRPEGPAPSSRRRTPPTCRSSPSAC